jgi:hypothetical protein
MYEVVRAVQKLPQNTLDAQGDLRAYRKPRVVLAGLRRPLRRFRPCNSSTAARSYAGTSWCSSSSVIRSACPDGRCPGFLPDSSTSLEIPNDICRCRQTGRGRSSSAEEPREILRSRAKPTRQLALIH